MLTADGFLDCGNGVLLHRYTATDFVVFVAGERVGLVRLGTGIPTEIGFEIDPQYRRRGVATAAVRALSDAVLEAGHVDYVMARTHRDNGPAQRVLENAGYTMVETLNDTLVYERRA